MARIKRGIVSRRKHRKLLNLSKGYWGTRSRTVRQSREAVLHAGSYAYHGRKLRKRNFRALWNVRISEAVKQEGISYNAFIHQLKKAKIELDRKILSDLVVNDPTTFKHIVDSVKNS